MNLEALEAGKAAYQRSDFIGAIASLTQAKLPGEIGGEADHVLGNSYMRLGQYENAARAYESALRDTAYGKRGPLSCNQGRALLAAGKIDEAIQALTIAVQDANYTTPYKAYKALGSAYERLGDMRNAGAAYRNAATDESNPNPSQSLRSLGSCFMRMNRPLDAVEVYRTALDFTSPLENKNQIYCDLALAYVAGNRMGEAVDAFARATADGTYVLSPEAQASYDAARKALATIQAKQGPSETDQLLASAGYANLDPLDPTGESGAFIPDPDDTGFFDISEAQMIQDAARERKVRRKHRHTGLKIFITLLILIIIGAGACFGAWWMGYGWPTQEAYVAQIFEARSNNQDMSGFLASSSSLTEQNLQTLIPQYASVKVKGIDRSRLESTVYVTATLSGGGEQDYVITLARDGIGWKLANVSASFNSQS